MDYTRITYTYLYTRIYLKIIKNKYCMNSVYMCEIP